MLCRLRGGSGLECAIGVWSSVLFIETPVFTDLVRKALDDDTWRALQIALLLRPFWEKARATCYMLFLYWKNEQGDLTAAQVRTLARLVREEFR